MSPMIWSVTEQEGVSGCRCKIYYSTRSRSDDDRNKLSSMRTAEPVIFVAAWTPLVAQKCVRSGGIRQWRAGLACFAVDVNQLTALSTEQIRGLFGGAAKVFQLLLHFLQLLRAVG